mmetsp:Transcript_32239/g.68227  ORF Transcript_32239/g.68227 Transcript_32239/m.68227 type:complete len:643 (-) Transcript_32239:91-2019(-)
MGSIVPVFILFILLVASITTTVVIFSSSLHHLRLTYEGDIASVNSHLRTVESHQKAYATQVATLTKLVSESLNATDEYIQNITDAVSETKESIHADMATVQDIQDNQNSLMAVQFAGMFTILVILVSGYHLSQHLRHMHSPVVQRKIMAVLWMTPIYSITSWMSLVFTSAEPYLAVIREFYESYCVYIFLSFLIAVLGRGDRHAVVDLLEERADQLSRPDKCRCGPKFWKRCWSGCKDKCGKRRRVPHDIRSVGGETTSTENGSNVSGVGGQSQIMNGNNNLQGGSIDEMGNYVSPARLKAEAVLDQCQMYAMQFVLLRPLTAIGWLVSNQLVEPKQFLDPTTPQLYITIVTNCSIFFAFRGLVRFYHATRSNLAWCNPWPKFMCIKGVVFMTFWQRMMLSLIVNLAYADRFDSQEDANDFIMRSQNFLICLEMLFSAVAHCFVFSTDEWAEGYREREEERRKRADTQRFGDSVALGDFISDVKVVMASKKRRKRRKQRMAALGDDVGLSPSSTTEEDDANAISLTNSQHSSQSSLEDTTTMKQPSNDYKNNSNVMKSSHSLGSFEGYIDQDDEYITELAPPTAVTEKKDKQPNRRRFDTGDSVDSLDGGVEMSTSLARIEKFINDHSPRPKPPDDDKKEIV